MKSKITGYIISVERFSAKDSGGTVMIIPTDSFWSAILGEGTAIPVMLPEAAFVKSMLSFLKQKPVTITTTFEITDEGK